MPFLDYFSEHADRYAIFRPHYPRALFEFLSSKAPSSERAWDCATGNGQAAEGLSEYFHSVVATDASKEQVQYAIRKPNILYSIALAEQPPLQSGSIDLITVAQAFHWLRPEPFFAGVKRILKKHGVLVVWCYNLLEVHPAIDALLFDFYRNIVGPYWAPERKLLEEGYRTMPFPFKEFKAPQFRMEANWNLSDLIGYLGTWSATQKYIRVCGGDPVQLIIEKLSIAWGDPNTSKRILWPLSIRLGRME